MTLYFNRKNKHKVYVYNYGSFENDYFVGSINKVKGKWSFRNFCLIFRHEEPPDTYTLAELKAWLRHNVLNTRTGLR